MAPSSRRIRPAGRRAVRGRRDDAAACHQGSVPAREQRRQPASYQGERQRHLRSCAWAIFLAPPYWTTGGRKQCNQSGPLIFFMHVRPLCDAYPDEAEGQLPAAADQAPPSGQSNRRVGSGPEHEARSRSMHPVVSPDARRRLPSNPGSMAFCPCRRFQKGDKNGRTDGFY